MNTHETVTLRLPRDPRYYGVARYVVGGLAAGLSLSYDAMDDLQLAIGSLLDHEDLPVTGDVTIRIEVGDGTMRASLGSFAQGDLAELMQIDADVEAATTVDLPRLLDTIVDGIDIQSTPEGDWITLTKQVAAPV